MITIQAQNIEVQETTAIVHLSIPALGQALRELGIPHPGSAAILISQWYFRVFLAGQGVRLNNGKTYIYDGYQEWASELSTVSKWQFGRIIRALCSHGLIEKGCFAHLKYLFPPKEKNPLWRLCHEDNKRSFIHVVHDRIVELIGFDPRKVFKNYKDPLKPSPQAKMQNCTELCAELHRAKCKTTPCTMYQDHSRNLQISPDAHARERENEISLEHKCLRVDREEELSYSCPNVNEENENLHQSLDEHNYSSSLVKRSAPRRNKSLQKSSQNDTFQGWSPGPWLNDAGQLNGDFVDWVTTKFMRDPRRGSDDFYGTQAKVLHYFRSKDTAIQDNWLIYHKQHLHLLATAAITESSGGTNTDKTLTELAKAKPAICNPGPQDITYRAPAAVHEYTPALALAVENAVNSGSTDNLALPSFDVPVLEAAESAAPADTFEVSAEAVAEVVAEVVQVSEDTPEIYPPIPDPWLDSTDSDEHLIEQPAQQSKEQPQQEDLKQQEQIPVVEPISDKKRAAVLQKLRFVQLLWSTTDGGRALVKKILKGDKFFILTEDGPVLVPEFPTD